MRLVPDGKQLLDADQAATFLGVSGDTLLHAARRHALTPARFGKRWIYTRADLDRYRKRLPQAQIVEALERGEAPIAAWLASGGAVSLKELGGIIAEWARVASFWVVQQPPGSYARWLQRLGLLRVNTTDLRRMIEAMCSDDYIARVARLQLDAARAARLQAEAARAQEAATRTAPLPSESVQAASATSGAP